MKQKIFHLTAILLFTLISINNVIAQTKKEPLNFEDIRQWRTHLVTLADHGEWYTTLYNLYDKPESVKDTITTQIAKTYYEEDNQTDVLYVFRLKDGLKYQIPDGNNPIFSSNSEWIAYQIKPESDKKKDEKDKKEEVYIELKHLESGYTVTYESSASYNFLEDKDYFITTDKNSLLVYDLKNRREHYIGNVGEYLVDKKSDYIAYTISSEDKRGNGVYIYDPRKMTTQALQTGNFLYSNLSWNQDKDALAFYKYNMEEDEVAFANVNVVIISGINAETTETVEYTAKDIEGFGDKMGFAVNSPNEIVWSKDGDRLFLKVKEYAPMDKKGEESISTNDKASVQVWHGKDKKLLSERIMEYDKQKDETFHAIFFRDSKSLVQLTGEEIQELNFSKGTDQWAVGLDNRKYISDWDVEKNDLYSINLRTGEKKLIQEKHSGSYYSPDYTISPDGNKMVFWDGVNYWSYDFEANVKLNISEGLKISFVDKDYNQFGYVPNYGITGWVKGNDAVIVNHKHDLWLLPLDGASQAQNMTTSANASDSTRFRFEDSRFEDESEIKDRYIDLSSSILLAAYNTQTKYAGFYKLDDGELTELIYEPASFYNGSWRGFQILKSKQSNDIIYVKGNYENFPEAYFSTKDFSKSTKITNTNPQQEKFRWGTRILIEYTNDDGIPLQGVLSIPEGYKKGQKLPMIVHSYETFSWKMYMYANPYLSGANVPEMLYVSDGYLFLQPDIHFNVGTPHSDMHESINAAIEKVIELGYVDEKRIGYEGFSFGGHCGMYISTQENKFAAIAAGAGVSNLVQGFNIDIVRNGSNEQDYYMTGQGRLGADPTSDTEMYIRESAVFQAQSMETPLLLFHGTDDKVVQWEHSFGFYSILRYLKKPVVFLSYLGEGHGMYKEENRLDLQRRLKEYFDHYLKGEKAKKWMTDELPYIPEEESENSEKDKKTSPKWK